MTLTAVQLHSEEVRALYLIQLQQLYSAEHQLLEALPQLAMMISLDTVKQQVLNNAAQAPHHLRRLEKISLELREKLTGPVYAPMGALVASGLQLGSQYPLGTARDLLLIEVVTQIKHLMLTKYTVTSTFAEVLDRLRHVAAFTQSKLDEHEIHRDLSRAIQSLRLVEQ